MLLNPHARIDRQRRLRRRACLRRADAISGVGDLALQVRQLHRVVIDDADAADPGRGEVEHKRRAKPARAHHQHARCLQLRLADPAHLVQQDVPRVAADLVLGEIKVHEREDMVRRMGCEEGAG